MRTRLAAALCTAVLGASLGTPALSPASAAPAAPLSPAAGVLSDREIGGGLADRPQAKPGGSTGSRSAAASAAADCTPRVVRTAVSPVKRPVGISEVQSVVFSADVYDPCNAVGGLFLTTYHQSSGTYGDGWLDWTGESNGVWHAEGTWTIDPWHILNEDAGEFAWFVAGYDYGDDFAEYPVTDFVDGKSWYLQRWTRMTNNASEPARKGTPISITATMTRANWDVMSYRPYTGRTVYLQQRPAAGGAYTTVKTLTTDAYGKVSTKVTAVSDVCFRVVFLGKSVSAAVTPSGDCVDVY